VAQRAARMALSARVVRTAVEREGGEEAVVVVIRL
jgi:hypothetical protein